MAITVDLSRCQDSEQLFRVDEHGIRFHTAITEALMVAMAVMSEYEITEENWIDIAAKLTVINRLLTPQNAVAVVYSIGTEESPEYRTEALDWKTVKRYIGMRTNIDHRSSRGFMSRMLDAVKNEIQAADHD